MAASASLEAVVDHEIYYRGQAMGRPLILTPRHKPVCVAFLQALTTADLPRVPTACLPVAHKTIRKSPFTNSASPFYSTPVSFTTALSRAMPKDILHLD
jgi:hypothetical protein